MMIGNLFEQALGLKKPWFIKDMKFSSEEKKLDIYIDFEKGAVFPYEEGGIKGEFKAYDTTDKTWRHLNFFEHECFLHARIPRVKINDKETRVIKAPWEGVLNGFTMLMESLLLQLCYCMPVAQVARLTKISDDKIWRMLEKYIQDVYTLRTLEEINKVGMDETSSRRGHDYVTLFVDLFKNRTIFIAEGKDSGTVDEFKEVLIIKGGNPEQIREISCDMSPAFIKGVETNFKNAEITFDRFHVTKVITEAVDEIRRQEARKNTVLKGTRYLFLKNRENLTEKERSRLEEITMAQAGLGIIKAHHYRELFQEIYKSESIEEFEVLLSKWVRSVMHTKLGPMKEAAKTIKKHWKGIVRWAESRINNGLLEGLNSIIQSAKSKARGYRTNRCFMIIIYLLTGKFDFKAINPNYVPI
jgi:transposase